MITRKRQLYTTIKEKLMQKSKTSAAPNTAYMKKIVYMGGDCPLSDTFTDEQIKRRVAFYQELNEKRKQLPHSNNYTERRFAVFGINDTTTVRVYMRETIENIAAQLFFSDFTISAHNVHRKKENGEIDKDLGHVVFTVRATEQEIEALLEYIRPKASYFVYDGERSKYVAGDTKRSEFVITKPDDRQKPNRFWRRSQSFIQRVEELRV